jgi:hypothetical protein
MARHALWAWKLTRFRGYVCNRVPNWRYTCSRAYRVKQKRAADRHRFVEILMKVGTH